LKPWIEITQYANNLVDQLKKRFPSTPFLNALKILDPREWKNHCETYIHGGIIIILILTFGLILIGIGIKLKSEFLQTLKELEKQFAPLISNTTIGSEFVDFLNERYKDVKDMNESQFIKYILNVRSDIYPNFIKFSHYYNG
jgi:hypothetical protein